MFKQLMADTPEQSDFEKQVGADIWVRELPCYRRTEHLSIREVRKAIAYETAPVDLKMAITALLDTGRTEAEVEALVWTACQEMMESWRNGPLSYRSGGPNDPNRGNR